MKEPADKPGSVANSHLSRMYVTTHLKQPTRIHYAGHIGFLFGLAPGGVYLAVAVATNAVRSYHTISTLLHTLLSVGRYIFCCTCRRLAPPRSYLAPCPIEPGLSSPTELTQSQLVNCPFQSERLFSWLDPLVYLLMA